MRTVRLLISALVATAALLAVPSAIAENAAVQATPDDVFTPARTAVKPGESVTFTNSGGEHNIVWNDGGVPPTPSDSVDPSQWPAGGVSRTFTKPGKYRYYCKLHGDPKFDDSMVGYVYVNPAGQIPPALTGLKASGKAKKATLKFRSSAAGKAKATFFLKSKKTKRFARKGTSTFTVKSGRTTKVVTRAFATGSWKVEVVVTDSAKLSSDRKTATFKVS